MTLTYMNRDRTLSIRGVITQQNGNEIRITESDVVMYSSYYGGFEGIVLGSVSAASFTLELNKVGRGYVPRDFDNAKVQMEIGLLTDGAFVYSAFGTWYVESCSVPEQSVSMTLHGYDALGSRFEAEYTDDGTYPTTIGSLVTDVCTGAGVRLDRNDFPNAAVRIEKMPEWEEGITLRDVLSYCAICAGGFAQITPDGKLEILSYADGRTVSVGADRYISFTPEGGSSFTFNAIEAMLAIDADEYTRFAVDGAIADNASNTLQIDYNPLLTESIINSVVTELKGYTSDAGALTWVGDPAVRCGDFFEVTMLDKRQVRMMATSLSFTFHGGLSCEVRCELPSANSVSSATYSASVSQYDSDGNVRVTRIPGLDQKIISATAGHFETLTAGNIETDRLTAALLKAIEIRAGKIDAESIETDVLTAIIAKIVEATISRIESGTITTDALYAALADIITLRVKLITAETISTDELYAALADVILLRAQQITAGNIKTDSLAAQYAEIITLLVQNITAGNIQADRLGAALAEFVTVYAGTGEFDFATIQNLVSNALSLQQGAMDTVYINNLAVTQANMLSATLGNLVLKGDDGKYYRVFIGSDGTISTEPVELTEGEIEAGFTGAGGQIVETSMNVGSLNASSIQASSAVINQILTTALTAGKITAGEALIASATIPELYAASIHAIGQSIELSAGRKNVVHRGETPPSDAGEGDLWVQPGSGAMYQFAKSDALPEFFWDENGDLYYQYGEDQEVYGLTLDENGDLLIDETLPVALTFGSDGRLMTWARLTPGDLRNSFVEIAEDYINIASGGKVNIDAGAEFNVNAGAAHFRTKEYTLSILADDDSEETVMDFDAESKALRVNEIVAGNVRPYVPGITEVTSAEVGGLDGLAGMLAKNQYEHIVYTQMTNDPSSDAVVISGSNSMMVEIVADALTRVPPIEFRGITGNVYMRSLKWSIGMQDVFEAVNADSGSITLRDCYIEASIGVKATLNARVNWIGLGARTGTMTSAGKCIYAAFADEGGEVKLFGLIPSGNFYEQYGGRITAIDTTTGEAEAPEEEYTTETLQAAVGYYGTEAGWKADQLYQGYSNGKGKIFGCMKFEIPAAAKSKTIQTATLTLHRYKGAGKGSAVDMAVYAGTTAFGSRPTLGAKYVEREAAAAPDATVSFDVTQAARSLANGAVKQLVLYTGEDSTTSGKVYSKQYAMFDSAALKITY